MVRINVLGDRHFQDRIDIRGQFLVGGIALVATIFACLLYFYWKQLDISGIEDDIKVAEKNLAELKEVRAKVETLEKYERNVKAVLQSIEFLKKLKVGPTMYLDHLNVELPPDMWLTTIEERSFMVNIEGFAFSNNAVAKFMTNLESSEEFVSVDLTGIEKAKVTGGKGQSGTAENLMLFKLKSQTKLGKKIAEMKAKEQAANQKGKKGKRKKK